MLPDIEGARLPNFPWHDFVFEQVLDYYDGPRLILQRSRGGQLYLAIWNDAFESTDRWLCLPVSEPRLREILSGEIPVLEALENPEDGSLVVVDFDANLDSVLSAVATTAAAVPEDSLPLEWVRLNTPVPDEIAGLPSREGAHLLDFRIGGRVGRVAADSVSRLIGNAQRLLDAIGQAKSARSMSTRGPVPNYIRKQTRLNLVGTYASSLGLLLQTDEQDSQSEESLARSSIEGLFSILEEAQQTSGPTLGAGFWNSRVAANYINFLSAIETSGYPASLRWNQPGSEDTIEFRITPRSAESMKSKIKAATENAQEEISLEGRFVSGNVTALRFVFRDFYSDDPFTVSVPREIYRDVGPISLDSPYMVVLRPTLQVNEVTGEERTTYTLRIARPL